MPQFWKCFPFTEDYLELPSESLVRAKKGLSCCCWSLPKSSHPFQRISWGITSTIANNINIKGNVINIIHPQIKSFGFGPCPFQQQMMMVVVTMIVDMVLQSRSKRIFLFDSFGILKGLGLAKHFVLQVSDIKLSTFLGSTKKFFLHIFLESQNIQVPNMEDHQRLLQPPSVYHHVTLSSLHNVLKSFAQALRKYKIGTVCKKLLNLK